MKDELIKTPQGKLTVKAKLAQAIHNAVKIRRFCGGMYYFTGDRYLPLTEGMFSNLCYTHLGIGLDKSRIKDLWHLFSSAAEDLTDMSRYVAFPNGKVWDTIKLDYTTEVEPIECVYSTNYAPSYGNSHHQYLLDLASGDEGKANDILQSIAPIFMTKKPTGVIFYLGKGQVGKSGLVEVIYRIIGEYLSDLSLEQIEEERDTPFLNGKIANVLADSNTTTTITRDKNYKLMGDHKPLRVHTFHSQEPTIIHNTLHYIMSTNTAPNFRSKDTGVRRRTHVIPFDNVFPLDETFYDRTFTPEFLSDFLGAVLEATKQLRSQNYKYQWSELTTIAKNKYDTEANTAETYIKDLISQDIVGFDTYKQLMDDYHQWCDENGYMPLGKKLLSAAATDAGFGKVNYRMDAGYKALYLMNGIKKSDIVEIPSRWGLYQIKDSKKAVEVIGENAEDLLQQLLELA